MKRSLQVSAVGRLLQLLLMLSGILLIASCGPLETTPSSSSLNWPTTATPQSHPTPPVSTPLLPTPSVSATEPSPVSVTTATTLPTPEPSPISATTTPTLSTPEPSPNPVEFPYQLDVAVSEFVGSITTTITGTGYSDPFHPATLWLFRDVAPEPELMLVADNTSYYFPEWSPDGEWLAYIQREGSKTMNIQVMNLGDRSSKRLTSDFRFGQLNSWTDSLSIRGWSANSQWLAFDYISEKDLVEQGHEGTTYVVNRETGNTQIVGYDITTLAWSTTEPEQMAFAITPVSTVSGEFRASVYVADIANLASPECVACQDPDLDGAVVCSLTWSPNGDRLALSIGRTGCAPPVALWVRDLDDGEWEVQEPIDHALKLAWSPDGQWLAGFDSFTLEIYDTLDWSIARSIPVSRRYGEARIRWTDTGELIFTQSTERGYTLQVLPTLNSQPYTLWDPEAVGLADRFLGFINWFVR